MKKFLSKFYPEILIFGFALFFRFFRLDYPKSHIFDEVYHAFTAQALAKWDPKAWEWWNTNPAGFAYEWTHPPLAKEFMAFSIYILGDGTFAWRFFSAVFGFGSIVLIYLIVLSLFKSRGIAIFASAVASMDGLLLVMSRIAMNDTYFLFFSLLAIFLFLKNKNLLMGIALGLAIASKWTGVFTILIIGLIFIYQNLKLKKIKFPNLSKFAFSLIILPVIVYGLSYTPFFLQHHSPPNQNFSNPQTFIELQKQMWWYHTNLKASHPYQSTPFDWIFDLRPVWLFVDYQKDKIANIYTLDNPIISWFGLISVFFLVFEFLKKRTVPYLLVLLSYLIFFILWFHSPRIMFNYHYLASTAFLTIASAIVLDKLWRIKNGKILSIAILSSMFILFLFFYPIWTAVSIPTSFNEHYFWLKSWK